MFQCHRVIVSACSPVLKAMMTSEMIEATKQQVTLDNIPPAVMELLLEYMYKGTIHIPNEYLQTAVEACDYLELLELKAQCVNQAPNTITPSNVISWHKLAGNFNISELKTKCSEIFASSMTDVSKGEEFLEMNLTEVNSCISGAQEKNADSDHLLEATTSWVIHDPQVRQDHILNMLEKINLAQCSVECLDTEMDKHKEFLDSQPAALRKLMKSVIQIANEGHGGIRKKRTDHRKENMVVIIPGQKGDVSCSDCWYLDKHMEFVDICKLPFSFPYHSVCQIPGGFVVTGGKSNTKCFMFLLSSKFWKQLEPLPCSRYTHGSIFMDGKIFLLGGVMSGTASPSVKSMEFEEGKWNQEPDMPVQVRFPEVAGWDANIFLLDTYDSSKLLHLDTQTKTWSTKANPPQQSYSGARMASTQDQLLVAGGSTKIFAQYNPTTDTWTTGNPPTLQHHLGALIQHDQKVLLIGGDGENRVEEYDLDTKSWSVCNFQLPKKLKNLHALHI